MTFFRAATRGLAAALLAGLVVAAAGCSGPRSYTIGGPPKIQKLMSGSSWRGREWVQAGYIQNGRRINNPPDNNVMYTFFSDGRGLSGGGGDLAWRYVSPDKVVVSVPGATGIAAALSDRVFDIRTGELWLPFHEPPPSDAASITWIIYGPRK